MAELKQYFHLPMCCVYYSWPGGSGVIEWMRGLICTHILMQISSKHLLNRAQISSLLQRGCSRVPSEEKGICQVSGEPCGRFGEPEQNAHRGTQGTQRPVLSQIRVMYQTFWRDLRVQRLKGESARHGRMFSKCFLILNCCRLPVWTHKYVRELNRSPLANTNLF